MISILQGDLTEQPVDAIVNAANTDLWLGAGVAGAIRKKGGPAIQEECNKHGPVKLGEAALTGAGNLKAKFVIHAASMGLGGLTTEESLRNATLNSLRLAEEKNLKSIAFPAIGTGVAGFPMDECARIMLGLARERLESKRTSLEQIAFVLFDVSATETFRRVAKELEIEAK